jgi:hypothetical protein
VPAALATDLLPWWRSASPQVVFTLAWLTGLAVFTAVVVVSTRRRHSLDTVAVAAVLSAGVVLVDVAAGGWLQLNGVAGYSAADGDRYTGLGTVGLGAFVAGLFLTAGFTAWRMPRAARAVTMAVLGCVGIVIVGSAYLGGDAAGAVAVTVGVCVAVVMASGSWLTLPRATAAAGAGVALLTCFAAIELSRPAQRRGSLGHFLASVNEGTAGVAVQRVGAANVVAVATSPLTLLALAGAAYVFFVLMHPWGGLKRLFGLYPTLRAAAAGLVTAAVLGGLLNGAGLVVAGAAIATALPLATLAALRTQASADQRTAPGVRAASAGRTAPEVDRDQQGETTVGPDPEAQGDPAGRAGTSGARHAH